MVEEKNTRNAQVTLSSTDLALERTMLAYERTLMAWVRTAISMISFGFTIYKFFQELTKTPEAQQSLLSPRIVGMIMISFGLLALILAQIQHQIAIKKLKQHYPDAQKSISSAISVLVIVFGVVLFLGVLLR